VRDEDAARSPGSALTERVIGAAIEVHRHLGPGLLEGAYEECLCRELRDHGMLVARGVPLPLQYKGARLHQSYRLDLVIGREVVVEVKAVRQLLPIHEAQLLTYLRMSGLRLGLLLNFNTPLLRDGIRRLVL
jgi:GxxExxY protein